MMRSIINSLNHGYKNVSANILCAFIFYGNSTAQPASYYINSSGDDHNSGTMAKPFRTIKKLNALKLQPDTKIYLQANAAFKGPLRLEIDENGNADHPIYITSYGNGKATIDGGLKEAMIVRGSFVIIKNIHVKGAGRKEGNSSNGIFIKGSVNSLISNIVTEGFQKSGIEINNCSGIKLYNVIARNNGFCGIYVSGIKSVSKNITIQNCRAENNAGDPSNFTNHSGNGIFIAGSDSVLIDHCSATNNGWDMPRTGNGPVGIWGYDCDHLVIQYCISYKNKTHKGASDGGGFDFDGGVTNSIMQYCLSYENEGSGYGLFQFNGAGLWSNNIVRYCISLNDGQTTPGAAGFLIWNESADSSGLSNCKVYNNVVYNTGAPAVRFDNKSSNKNFLFTNNIFIGKDDIVNGPSSGEKFIGNIWWNVPAASITFRGHKNLQDWARTTQQEMLRDELRGVQLDPVLAGPFTTTIVDPRKLYSLKGFKLQHASPIRKQRMNLNLTDVIAAPLTDFYGEPVIKSAVTPGIQQVK